MRHIKYFEQVARGGSIRKAADNLHIAASAISRSIAQLEYELGVELFDRASRGMVLTAAGEIYLRYARSTLLDAERVKSELDSLKGLKSGQVKISSIEGMTADFVVLKIAEFRKAYPGVRFDLEVASSDSVTKAVRTRDADIGVTADTFTGEGVEVAERIEEPMLLACSPDYDGIEEGSGIIDILTRGIAAVPDERSAIRKQLDSFCHEQNVSLKPALVTNSISALRSFARSGAGVTILPRLAFRDDLQQGHLTGTPILEASFPQTVIEICIPSGWRLSLASLTFLKYLRAGAAQMRGETETGAA